MSWICPECENQNEDMLIRCICGHEIEAQQTLNDSDKSTLASKPDQIFKTTLKLNEIVSILIEQIDSPPSGLQYFNTFTFQGTSPVCGLVDNSGFELSKNTYPWLSLIAQGKFVNDKDGTKIEISYRKPKFLNHFWGFIFNRYKYDKKIILSFLKEWINIKEIVEPAAAADR